MTDFATLHEKHLREVRAFTPEAVSHLDWSRDRVLEHQTLRLREVVAHAQQHSPFYAERLGRLEAGKLQLGDLHTLPPVTKADVMDHWDRVVTDPRLHLDDMNAHLRRLISGEAENPYYLDRYYGAATGGSSGKRGLFLWDWESFIVIANVTYRFDARRDLAEPPSGPRRTAVICAGSYVHASRMVFPTMLDRQREVLVLPANVPIADMVRRLNEYKPDRIVGYASIVQELCAEALDGALTIHPRQITTNSEPLLPEARKMSRQAWGIDVHNSWGSVEIGLAAAEGDSFSGITLAEDFLIFEPVDAHDQPVQDSSRADRILVTKLFGTVMPLVRYEMTDTMVIDERPTPDAPGMRRIREIKGRADTWFVYRETIKIHPMVFRGVLGQDHRISEYQVQQTPGGARVLAITHGDFSAAAVEQALVRSLAEAGLNGAQISVESVAELPRHAETSKLKRFVPLANDS